MGRQPTSAASSSRVAWGVAALATLALVVLAVAGPGGDDAELALPVTLGEMTRDAEDHVGRTVVLASVVEDVLGDGRAIGYRDRGVDAFTFGAAGEIVVVGDRLAALAEVGAGEAIRPGDVAQVTGEVGRWSRERIEAAIGRRLAPQFAGDFPRTVLVARDVTTIRVPA